MSDFLKTVQAKGDWIWRGATTLLLLGNLWLQTHFVMKTEYAKDQDKLSLTLTSIEKSITGLDKSIALMEANRIIMDQQAKRIEDHENRIRVLENATRK